MNSISKHICILLVILATSISAQVEVSGLTEIVFKNKSEDFSNETFRGFSNFHSTRARLFFDAQVAENTYAFTQILIDDYDFSLFGAYLRFEEVVSKYINLHVGYIPTTIGSFGPRAYSNINPLIGKPFIYNYHTSFKLSDGVNQTADEFLAHKETRSRGGLPIIYDACWNTGVEVYGSFNKIDYSLGLLSGALGKPTVEQQKEIPQVTTRVAYYLSSNITLGLNGFYGPYLFEGAIPDSLPTGKKPEDYMNYGYGYDLYIAYYLLEIYSEFLFNVWEHPYLENLEIYSGYLEAEYKFSPGWYIAGRYEILEPGKIENSSGEKEKWDYSAKRYEYGIGYRPNRSTTVKLVNQLNRFAENESLNHDKIAMQVSVMFR